MNNNRISATLPKADADAVAAAISTIRQKLPFLIDLTADERRALTKLGDKSRAFVLKALEVATQNPTMLPGSFGLQEMKADVELFESLEPIFMAINKLQDLIDDTLMLAGSEAYAAALAVYTFARLSDAGEALELAADDLGRRFVRKSKRGTSPATDPTRDAPTKQ